MGAQRQILQGLAALGDSEMQALWTELVDELLEKIFLEVVGASHIPCNYAFIACGSGARQEMCPNSDIDFALLIANDANNVTFRGWVESMRDKVNLFRENEVDSIPGSSSQRKGLRFCSGGLNPLGGGEVPELIRSPAAMAELLESDKLDSHAAQGLQETRLMFGTGDIAVPSSGNDKATTVSGAGVLYYQFEKERSHALSRTTFEFSATPLMTLNRRKGLGFIKEALGKAIPLKDDLQWDIKQQFYRLPQFIVKGLATYYGVPFASTLKQVEALEGMGHVSMKYANLFRRVLTTVGKVRVLAHLETGTESDKVYTTLPKEGEKRYSDQKQLTAEQVKDLQSIVDTLAGLQDTARVFYHEKTKFVFNEKRLNPFRNS